MKKLIFLFLAFAAICVVSSCRRAKPVEFTWVVADSAQIAADTTDIRDEVYGDNEEGLMAIPDIPQERDLDPTASDYELERMMSGREEETFEY